jgi:hypothetical protein
MAAMTPARITMRRAPRGKRRNLVWTFYTTPEKRGKEKGRVEVTRPPTRLAARADLDDGGRLGLTEDRDRLFLPGGEPEARARLELSLGGRALVDGSEVLGDRTGRERLAMPAVEPANPRGPLLRRRASLLTERVTDPDLLGRLGRLCDYV